MPQLMGYVGEPWAIGIEAGTLVYVFEPGRFFLIGGNNAGIVHAMLAGLFYYAYNVYVQKNIPKNATT